MDNIYLDYAATAPLKPVALEAMMPYLTGEYGNPSSLHRFGRAAREGLIEARDLLADILGCEPARLTFTSGGTESDNLAVFGVMEALAAQGKKHVVTTAIEHHAVLHACRTLERKGARVTYVTPDAAGFISPESVRSAIREDTALVSVMYANNEVGTLQPIEQIGQLCREHGVLFHTDAVQAFGALPIRLSALPVDLMSLSAHKIGGPKGVGLLCAARRVPLEPMLYGGSQERKRRPGTENVAAIAGFAAAARLAQEQAADKQQRMSELRAHFLNVLESAAGPDGFVVNGHPEYGHRLESIVNVSFPGLDKETLLMNLDLEGVAASGGAACTSGSLEDSHVLTAMGLDQARVQSSIRFSFGEETTADELARAAQIAGTIASRLRMK